MWRAAEVAAVDRLAHLVRWTGQGVLGVDWQAVEREIGVALPSSFKAYVARFPAGQFQTYLHINQPRSSADIHDYVERLEGELDWFREYIGMTSGFPYEVYLSFLG